MSYGHKTAFIGALSNALADNPDNTIGEILMSVLHCSNFNGKHFFYVSDEEIYTATENFNSIDMSDEIFTETEFDEWRDKVCKG